MRKILFLDIDGVVNNSKSHEKYSYRGMLGIDPNLAFLVGKIVLDTGCEVVLSSSWRGSEKGEQHIREQVCDFVDVTPHCTSGVRGAEIHLWLMRNCARFGSTGYNQKDVRVAILDDSSDMLMWQKDCFFRTSWDEGITPEIAEAVTKHLNGV